MESEKAVIGSVLLNGKLEDLQATDFTDERLVIIWDAMQDVSAKGDPIDLVTVATKIHSWGKSNTTGSPEILAELQNIPSTGSHSEKYARLVKEAAMLRKIKEVLGSEFEEGTTNDEIIGNITAELNSLTRPVNNRSMTELLIEFEKRKKEKKKGLLTGFEWLDGKTNGIGEGMMWVISAKSGVGKTTIALQAIRNICDETGEKAVLYTLEQVDVMVLQNLERIQRHNEAGMGQLAMMRLDIVDSLRTWNAISIDAQKREAKVIVVDYAQMVGIKGRSLYEKMENLAFAIRGFCNMTKISVVLISQVSEDTRKNKGEHDGAKGGGDLFNASDVFINLRSDTVEENEQRKRDAYYAGGVDPNTKVFTRDFIIAKNKYGTTGYKQIKYNYELGYGVYVDL